MEEWGERSGQPLGAGCRCSRAALPGGAAGQAPPKGNPHLLSPGAVGGPPTSPLPFYPDPSSVPVAQRLGGTAEHLLSELPHRRKSKWSSCPERLSEQPPSQSNGLQPLLFHSEKGNSHKAGPSIPSSQAAQGCRLWTGEEGKRRWRQLSSLLPPLPCGWAAGHEISSRRWGRG